MLLKMPCLDFHHLLILLFTVVSIFYHTFLVQWIHYIIMYAFVFFFLYISIYLQ